MDQLKCYPKKLLLTHLSAITQLEEKIKTHEIFKNKTLFWLGAYTLSKPSIARQDSTYDVGGLAVACFNAFDEIAVLCPSDMGLIEQFVKEFISQYHPNCHKVYVFSRWNYEEFIKHFTRKDEVVLIDS